MRVVRSWFYDCPFDSLQRNLSGFLSGKATTQRKTSINAPVPLKPSKADHEIPQVNSRL